MLARETSESDSNFEILQECKSSLSNQKYSLTVEFEKVVYKKVKAIGEKSEHIE